MKHHPLRFGIGVLGATGFIGAPYRAEIREAPADARIVALCARRRELLEQAAALDGALLATDDWRAVVEHPQVDVVIVATPDAQHQEAVLACAAAGKHVVCEKPVGRTAGEAREMWDAVRDQGLAHFVPFWTRYVPVFRRARELVRDGLLGEVRGVIYRWHNPRPADMPFTWRDDANVSSAGSIADVGSHAYDTVRWMLGQEAVRVLAFADVLTPPKPDLGEVNLQEALERGQRAGGPAASSRKKGTAFDYGDIAFVLEGGAVGSLVLSHATYFRKGLAPELELHGERASLAVDRLTGRLTMAQSGAEPELLEQITDTGFGNRFARHVFPALRERIDGKPCEHPGLEDGWRVQLFTDAAAESARQGRWMQL